jgi:hypothetical protein
MEPTTAFDSAPEAVLPPTCNRRGCKTPDSLVLMCAAPACNKHMCVLCFQKSHGDCNWNLEKDHIVCTKACYRKFRASLSHNPKWDSDGKEGKEDPITSVRILLDWLLVPGNYANKWRGKNNNGERKKKVAERIANEINAKGVVINRDAKQVYSKIQHLEERFKAAHDWSTTVTGAGMLENDKGGFDKKVLSLCPHYFDLLPIMGERSSAKPKATNEDDLSDSEDMPMVGVEDSSDEDDDEVLVDTTPNNFAVAASGRAAKRRGSSLASSHTKKPAINVGVSDEANEAMVALARARGREINRRAKRDELDQQIHLLQKCEEVVKSHPTWPKQRILRIFPQFKTVIDAVMELDTDDEES